MRFILRYCKECGGVAYWHFHRILFWYVGYVKCNQCGKRGPIQWSNELWKLMPRLVETWNLMQ